MPDAQDDLTKRQWAAAALAGAQSSVAPSAVSSPLSPQQAVGSLFPRDAHDDGTKRPPAAAPIATAQHPVSASVPVGTPALPREAATPPSKAGAPDIDAPRAVAAPPTVVAPVASTDAAAHRERSAPAPIAAKSGFFGWRRSAPPPISAASELEPIAYSASARLDVDSGVTLATNATPRGPEIRIAARLDAGKDTYRELPAEKRTGELIEETK